MERKCDGHETGQRFTGELWLCEEKEYGGGRRRRDQTDCGFKMSVILDWKIFKNMRMMTTKISPGC